MRPHGLVSEHVAGLTGLDSRILGWLPVDEAGLDGLTARPRGWLMVRFTGVLAGSADGLRRSSEAAGFLLSS